MPTCIPVQLAGTNVVIRVAGSPRLSEILRNLYDARPSSGAAGEPDVEVRWKSGRGTVRVGGRSIRRSWALPGLGLWTEWLVAQRAIARLRKRVLILHAAWVATGKHGILLLGRRGAGKSSLAVALAMRHGFRLLADDMVSLGNSGVLRPMERPVRLKPGAASILPELGSLRLDLTPWRRGWTVLVPLRRFGNRTGRLPLVRTLLFLDPRQQGPLRLAKLSQGVALARMARMTINFKDRPGSALQMLSHQTATAGMFTLSGGSLEDRCRAVCGLVSA